MKNLKKKQRNYPNSINNNNNRYDDTSGSNSKRSTKWRII